MSANLLFGMLADCAVVALTLMGVYVTYSPPDRTDWPKQKQWYAAFGCIAALYVAAAAIEREEQDSQNAHFADAVTGGNNYAFVKAEITDPKNITDAVQVSINATGWLHNVSFWIAPLSSKYPDGAYFSVDRARPPMDLNEGGHVIGTALLPGEYRVEFTASNGTFVEFLTLQPSEGVMTQFFHVCRGTKRLYTYPIPRRTIATCSHY